MKKSWNFYFGDSKINKWVKQMSLFSLPVLTIFLFEIIFPSSIRNTTALCNNTKKIDLVADFFRILQLSTNYFFRYFKWNLIVINAVHFFSGQLNKQSCVYILVFHRILDFKAGWISIRPYFFPFIKWSLQNNVNFCCINMQNIGWCHAGFSCQSSTIVFYLHF